MVLSQDKVKTVKAVYQFITISRIGEMSISCETKIRRVMKENIYRLYSASNKPSDVEEADIVLCVSPTPTVLKDRRNQVIQFSEGYLKLKLSSCEMDNEKSE